MAKHHKNANQPRVYNVKLVVPGKSSIPLERKKIIANSAPELVYQEAFLGKLVFSPQEKLAIQHYYTANASEDVRGFNQVNYVLKTGALWQRAPIKDAQIEVIPNTSSRLCSELNKDMRYNKPKPNGMKILGKGKNRRYVWHLKNFSPKDDLSLCIQTGQNYIRYRVVYPLLQEDLTHLHKMNKAQLTLIKNTIYAQYGRLFKLAKLQNYFNRQWWYEINPTYTDKLLTPTDKKLITIIKQELAKKTS